MMQSNSSRLRFFLALALGLATASCVPIETQPTLTLYQVRLGKGHGVLAGDLDLRPGETRAEVLEVIPARREIRVRTDDGREHAMTYNTSRFSYHGWDYAVENLESGDIIAFQTAPRESNYVDTIRVLEPVQARIGPAIARPLPPSPRPNVIEGTVERIQYDQGIFDVRTRASDLLTVSLPYSARASDVESFRRLRTGDYVRLEGEFVNRDNLQLYSFLSPR
jgi:hypothetical protein